MKRALIVTYYWPPSGGSGVQRWVKFSKYLPSLGWQPVIYTPMNPELTSVDTSLGDEIPSEAEIIKLKIREPYGIYRAFAGRKSHNSEVNPINSVDKTLKHRIFLWIRANFFIPDPRISWVRPSLRFLRGYLLEHPVDLIVSTGPPHSMHLIARKLSKVTGLPWIADFRDPWTRMFYYKDLPLTRCSDRKQHEMERAVLNDASVVVAVSPLVQEEFKAMTSTPVMLVTNGYDEDDFTTLLPEGDCLGDFFRVTHTGLFSFTGNPDILWRILARRCSTDMEFAANLRIRLAGKIDNGVLESIKLHGLESRTDNLGYLPHKTAVLEQQQANILILPLRREPEYKFVLPGKLFEYLASKRPILGIGQKDGAMAEILKETRAGLVADWDEESLIEAFIEKAWRAFKGGEPLEGASHVEQYSRRTLSLQMVKIMDALVKG